MLRPSIFIGAALITGITAKVLDLPASATETTDPGIAVIPVNDQVHTCTVTAVNNDSVHPGTKLQIDTDLGSWTLEGVENSKGLVSRQEVKYVDKTSFLYRTTPGPDGRTSLDTTQIICPETTAAQPAMADPTYTG